MIDIDLNDIKVIPSEELNYLEIERIKEVEQQNKNLTNVLKVAGVMLLLYVGALVIQDLIEERKKKNTL